MTTATIASALADYLSSNLTIADVEVKVINFDRARRIQGFTLSSGKTSSVLVHRGALSFVPVDRAHRTVLWETSLMVYAADDGAVEDLVFDIAFVIDDWEQGGGGEWVSGTRYFRHCESMVVANTYEKGAIVELRFVRPMETR